MCVKVCEWPCGSEHSHRQLHVLLCEALCARAPPLPGHAALDSPPSRGIGDRDIDPNCGICICRAVQYTGAMWAERVSEVNLP